VKIFNLASRPRNALAVGVGASALFLLAAAPAGAVTGPGAYGAGVNATVTTGLLPPVAVVLTPTPEVHAPVSGTATASLLTAAAPPLLTTGVLQVQSNQGSSQAAVDNASALGGRLTATAIKAECTGPLGRTDLVGATLNGSPVLDVTPAPNTTLLNAGGITIIANRQFTNGSGDFVVRGIEITLSKAPVGTGVASGTIVISEARCNNAAPIPAGAIGGLGLAGIVGVAFVGQQVISRRRRAATASTLAS